MNSLETAPTGIVSRDRPSLGVSGLAVPLVGPGQGVDGGVGDVVALDETDPLELWQDGKSSDRLICQVKTAAKVNITNTVAAVDEPLHSLIRKINAVAEVHVVQVLSELRDGKYSLVCDVPALGENDVAQPRSSADDLLDGAVCYTNTRGEIEDAQVLIGLAWRKGEERAVVYELAICQAQLSERLSLCQE